MEGILFYILKVCLASSVMVLVFRIMFRKERYFQFNRLYLLGAVLIPWVLPLITLKVHAAHDVMPVQPGNLLADMYAFSGSLPDHQASQAIPWPAILFFLYAGGLFFFLLQLSLSFIRIGSLTKRCIRRELLGRQVYLTRKDLVPFSFLNKIVISEKTKQHPRLRLMLDHEKIHVKQWHTLDIVIAEFYRALQWFSPFAWMLVTDLKTNLEYIADEGVAGNSSDLEAYQSTLVSLAAGFTPPPLTNSFNYTQLKKRMIMMTKTLQTRKFTWKYLLVLPLLAGLLFTFCSKESIYDLGSAELTVTGKVTDASSNEPLSGVAVMLNDMSTGVVTNENGAYRITLAHPADTLKFVTDNGQAVSVLPAGRNKVDISLDTGSGIRIRGFGSMSGVQPLYFVDGVRIDEQALSQMDPNDIESVQVLKNGGDAAVEYAGTEEARERGVIIIKTKFPAEKDKAGEQTEAENQSVQIRATEGFSSLSEPIYVIDNIPYHDGMPELDVNDIQSVQVLKDASAYAFLGTEEGRQRGVIIITTKDVSQEIVVTGYGSPKSGTTDGTEFFNRLKDGGDNGTDPIIMLDGAVYEGTMDAIDPNTIESIQVMKGDQAFEVFGTEEARQKGVIIVTSKMAE